MDTKDLLVDLEKGFWRASFAADGDYYDEHLADAGLLVFPDPTGVLDKASCVEIIRGSPARATRWEISDVRFLSLGEQVAALTYQGVSTPEAGGASERDRRTSVYHLRDGRWQLALHHVTPER